MNNVYYNYTTLQRFCDQAQNMFSYLILVCWAQESPSFCFSLEPFSRYHQLKSAKLPLERNGPIAKFLSNKLLYGGAHLAEKGNNFKEFSHQNTRFLLFFWVLEILIQNAILIRVYYAQNLQSAHSHHRHTPEKLLKKAIFWIWPDFATPG